MRSICVLARTAGISDQRIAGLVWQEGVEFASEINMGNGMNPFGMRFRHVV